MFLGFYNYTVILTYIGLGSAVCGMFEAMERDYKTAVLCLLICGLCDMFDGTIARTCKKRSPEARCFGTQIDSLCDLVCFGVFPAMLGYSLCPVNLYSIVCMVFYVLAAVIRLAYFNVQEICRTEGKREFYEGMPVTSSALIMPIVALITTINRVTWAFLYPTCLLGLGLLFILRFRVRKPYLKGLTCMVAIGLITLFLVLRYGGEITCLKTIMELPTNV